MGNNNMRLKHILAVIFITAMFAFVGAGCALFPTKAPTDTPTEGVTDTPFEVVHFRYTVTDNEVTLTKYTGKDSNVTIPETIGGKSVKYIGKGCFENTQIKSLRIPSCIERLGEEMCLNVLTLNDVSFDDIQAIKSIGCDAFKGTGFLNSMIKASENNFCSLGRFVIYVNENFDGEIIMQNGVTEFADNVLEDSNISGIVFGNECISIKTNTVLQAKRLKKVTILAKGAIIDDGDMFNALDALIVCYAGTKAESYALDKGYFYSLLEDENSWSYENQDGMLKITGYNGGSQNVMIPREIDGVNVAALGEYVFANSAKKTLKLYIPKSVTCIESNFACGETRLKDVVFESAETLKILGKNAFEGTSFLEDAMHENDMFVIGTVLVKDNRKGDIIVPQNITVIASDAFGRDVTSITIEEGCQYLGEDMLLGCSNVKWIYIPNSITEIDVNVFNGAEDIKIVCDAVSYAAIFAQENGFNFEVKYYWNYELDDENKIVTLKQYTGKQKYVVIPRDINGYKVTRIDSIRNSTIITLYVPSSINYISDMFAYSVRSLESVVFEDEYSIKYIGAKAFRDTKYEQLTKNDDGMLIIGDIVASFTGSGNVIVPEGIKSVSRMAFSETDVESVVLPESLESIGAWAFRECSNLSMIYIQDSVTSIGERILDGSENAKICCHTNSYAVEYAKENGYSYDIVGYENWEYSINEYDEVVLIKYTGNSTNVTIPRFLHGKPVTSIGEECLAATDIITVYIPGGINSIYSRAFAYNEGLVSVIFENSDNVEYIGDDVFYGTKYFDELDGLIVINNNLIKCTYEGDVILPDYITSIVGGAFTGSGITSVTINEACRSIGEYIFEDMKNLEWVYIPDGVESIKENISDENKFIIKCHKGSYAEKFAKNNNYTHELIADEYEYEIKNDGDTSYVILMKYRGSKTEISVPRRIGNYVVRGIGKNCFADCKLTYVYVHDDIRIMYGNAFGPELQYVEFENPYNIEKIYDTFSSTVFENETNMINGFSIIGNIITKAVSGGDVIIPANIRGIAQGAFAGNMSINSITVNDGCIYIGDDAFKGSAVQWVYIGKNTKDIGSNILAETSAFIKCSAASAAERYALDNGYNYIVLDKEKFEWQYTIKNGSVTIQGYNGTDVNIYIPSDIVGLIVDTIADGCFENSYAEYIYIPSTVRNIGNRAFANAVNLRVIEFENIEVVKSIGSDALINCPALENFFDDKGFAEINGILIAVRAEGDVILNKGVTAIAGGAMRGLKNITSIVINSYCERIGEYAFADMPNLTQVTIPYSVSYIDDTAFNATQLTVKCFKESLAEIFARKRNYDIELQQELFDYEVVGGNIVITGYKGSDKSVIIPLVINGARVVALGDGAFKNSEIEYIWIPDSVTDIGDMCFYSAYNLKYVEFLNEKTIKNIGLHAFRGTLYENVYAVNEYSYVAINNILTRHFGSGNIIVDSSIRSIAGGAFFDRQNIERVTINDGCLSISANAFSQLKSLKVVNIPDSVVYIEANAFGNCSDSITILCRSGSAAEAFARKYNISCVIVK